jgi:predicted permease
MGGLRWLADARQDLRYLVRTVRRSPGFVCAVVLTLALGIGANTAVFSVVNAVLLRPLPYPSPDRIVLLANTIHGRLVGSAPGVSAPKFIAWRQSTAAFAEMAAYSFGRTLDLTNPDDPQPVAISRASADFFHLFGARMARGRAFSAADDQPGGARVVVLSDRFWRRKFAGSTQVIGETLVLDGDPYAIVGVLEPGFDIETLTPAQRPDVWLPLQLNSASADDLNFLFAAARLRDGVSFEVAQAETVRSADVVRRAFPAAMPADRGLAIDHLQAVFVRDVRPSLLLLWSVVALVLFIACANIVNLLLVRASVRQREIAIRLATGASRSRIVRQLLTESVALALVGGGTGLALAAAGMRLLPLVDGWNLPGLGTGSGVSLDAHVLLITVTISVATGVAFGLVPALRASRVDLETALKAGAREHGTDGRYNLRGLLVVSEVALALMLLVVAALLIRSFVALRQVNPGFEPHNVLTMQTVIVGRHFSAAAPVRELGNGGLERLSVLPGVESAAASLTGVPLDTCCALNVGILGRPRDDEFSYAVYWNLVSPGYFDVLKIPLVRGREFTERDDAGATPVVLINQAMAKRYWPDSDPLRDSLLVAPRIGGELEETVPRRIVGIVGDVRYYQLRNEPRASMYVPLNQVSERQVAFLNRLAPTMTWLIRTRAEPRVLADAIQREVRTAGGGLRPVAIRTMDDVSGASTSRDRFEMSLVTIFGAVALLLAAVGLYGIMSYSVQTRRREIGIRLALGAESHQLRRMVLAQAMAMACAGIAVGLAGALALTRFMAGLLFGVGPYDRDAFVIVPLVLIVVAFAAAWIPARRASTVDPIVAFRAE